MSQTVVISIEEDALLH